MKKVLQPLLLSLLLPQAAPAEWLSFTAADVERRRTAVWLYETVTEELINFSEQYLNPLHNNEEFRPFLNAVWSPDGRRIAYTSSEPGIYVADLVEGRIVLLTEGVDSSPSWSPDGRRLVVSRRGTASSIDYDLHTVDVERGETSTLIDDAGGLHSPRWGPDGRIAFVRQRSLSARTDIWLVDPDEPTDEHNLTGSVPMEGAWRPAWDPSGQSLTFTYTSTLTDSLSTRGLWRIRTDGSVAEPLGLHGASDGALSASGWLAYLVLGFRPEDGWLGFISEDSSQLGLLQFPQLTELARPEWPVWPPPEGTAIRPTTWGVVKTDLR